MRLTTKQIERFNDMTQAIAPELTDRMPKVVDAEDYPEVDFGGSLGWCNREPSAEMRERANLDEGRCLIALDCDEIKEVATPGCFEDACNMVHVHELAHVLQRPSVQSVETMATHSVCPMHDQRFVRVALHLWQRAQQAGFSMPCRQLVSPFEFWRSDEALYADTLAAEIRRFDGQPYEEIQATAPPQSFIDLWNGDLKRKEESPLWG